MPLQDCSVDAIVTDPPYGLEFMGKEWDRLSGKGRYQKGGVWQDVEGYSPPAYKGNIEAQLWHTQWLTEAYRVLKPGGSMLVMGGTRTFHRLMCAIEDSGFIIKDTLMWIYGSGFPKAQDLGKMIDKRNGRNQEIYKPFAKYLKEERIKKKLSMSEIDKRLGTNTAYSWWEGRLSGIQLPTMEYYLKLKEILNLDDRFDKLIEREEAEREKIGKHQAGLGSGKTYAFTDDNIKANKEIDDTLASTDLAKYWDGFKVGGIKPAYEPIVWAVKPPEGSYVDNVLKWEVGAVNVDECRIGLNGEKPPSGSAKRVYKNNQYTEDKIYGNNKMTPPKGRFPANIILDEESAKVMDEQSGDVKSHGGGQSSFGGIFGNKKPAPKTFASSGGASRFFYCAKSSRSERNAGLDNLQGENQRYQDGRGNSHECFEMEGCGRKTGTVNKNNHPTVKPIKLFEWLIKLVTREGQTVLDPFLGSGTTAISAHNTGRKCIGIEKEGEYIEMAKKRVEYHESQPRQMEIGA